MEYIKDFNNKDTIIVISDYPEQRRKGEKNYGIAWYTKTLIEPISKKYNKRFVVFAEKVQGGDNSPKLYANGRILVLRIFDQKHPSLFPIILKWLFKFDNVKYVQVHSEFFVNGGIKNFALLLPFILLIKLTRKHITYFSHNVVTNLDFIAKHFGLSRDSLKLKIFNLGLKTMYRSLGFIVNKFVVMDEVIYDRLSKYVNPEKIVLNRFWLDKITTKETVSESKNKIGVKKDEFVLLYFGFVSYYKGADWIINSIKKLRENNEFKNVRLVIAGGEAYSLKHEKHYQEYYKELVKNASHDKGIKITGFVPEEDIPTYFQAADLVVFPYRGLIGGSGCFSHAITYGKPFILSSKMSKMLKNDDIEILMDKFGLKNKDIAFNFNLDSFGKLIKKTQEKSFNKVLTEFSTTLGETRNSSNLIAKANETIFEINDKPRFSINIKAAYALIQDRV